VNTYEISFLNLHKIKVRKTLFGFFGFRIAKATNNS